MTPSPEEIYENGLKILDKMAREDRNSLESDEAEIIRDELDVVWIKIDPDMRKRIERKVRCPDGCVAVEEEQSV